MTGTRPSAQRRGAPILVDMSDPVSLAFEATPRADFLPAGARLFAGIDAPHPIGYGATNSQPSTVRHMLQLLQVPSGARVLDVGSGSGWTTALLAHLVGPTGSVLGLELTAPLVTMGASNLAAIGRPWARIAQADPDHLGAPSAAPFDRILVSAMADSIPRGLLAQLAPDGVMVIPVAGRMVRVRRVEGGEPEVERFGAYRFVPLR